MTEPEGRGAAWTEERGSLRLSDEGRRRLKAPRKLAKNVTVACCQLTPAFGDPAANRELAADAVRDAAGQGARVVVLPELISSGYVFASQAETRACAEAADGPTVSLWAKLAA